MATVGVKGFITRTTWQILTGCMRHYYSAPCVEGEAAEQAGSFSWRDYVSVSFCLRINIVLTSHLVWSRRHFVTWSSNGFRLYCKHSTLAACSVFRLW